LRDVALVAYVAGVFRGMLQAYVQDVFIYFQTYVAMVFDLDVAYIAIICF
jgi:hypothetical protein